MTKYEWESELKRNVHRLPDEEIKRVLEYYDELFADKIEQGKTETEIIATFGNPVDVADKLLAEYDGKKEKRSERIKKVAARTIEWERRSHFIQSAMILMFSAVLLICSFFIGMKVRLHVNSVEIPVRQSMFKLIQGASALFEIDEGKMEKYVQQVNEEVRRCGETDVTVAWTFDGNADALEKSYTKVGKNLAKNTNINVLKYNIYSAKLRIIEFQDNITIENTDERAQATCYMYTVFCAVGLGFLTISLVFATIIATLIYSILSIIALVRRKSVCNTFKPALFPLALMLFQWMTLVSNPMLLPDGMCVALIIVSLCFCGLLCVYRFIVERNNKLFSVCGFARNIGMIVAMIIAFFSASGKVICLHPGVTSKALQWHLTVGFLLDFSKLFTFVGVDGVVTGVILYSPVWVFYETAVSLIAVLLISLWNRLYNGNYNRQGILSKAVSIIVFLVLTIFALLAIYANNPMLEFIGLLMPTANFFVALVFTIGVLLINGLLKVKSKSEEKDIENVAENVSKGEGCHD